MVADWSLNTDSSFLVDNPGVVSLDLVQVGAYACVSFVFFHVLNFLYDFILVRYLFRCKWAKWIKLYVVPNSSIKKRKGKGILRKQGTYAAYMQWRLMKFEHFRWDYLILSHWIIYCFSPFKFLECVNKKLTWTPKVKYSMNFVLVVCIFASQLKWFHKLLMCLNTEYSCPQKSEPNIEYRIPLTVYDSPLGATGWNVSCAKTEIRRGPP